MRWFPSVLQVVYADNVHFGHISQKLSSVAYKGQTTKIKPFPLLNLLPKLNMSQYYRYYGSLTTPPCSQAVVWTLYEVPVYISWSQVGLFRHIQAVHHQSFLTDWFFSPSAGSVHLADLLHGGGRRAGHTSAEQLQTHPPHLQPRRFHVQRCQTPSSVVLSPAQVGYNGAAASRCFSWRFHLQILTIIACF